MPILRFWQIFGLGFKQFRNQDYAQPKSKLDLHIYHVSSHIYALSILHNM
jgi:hypothetical protein